MGFSLKEIAQLLIFREAPQKAKPEIRKMASAKLADIEKHLQETQTLKNELTLLVNLCTGSTEGCPIIDDFQNK